MRSAAFPPSIRILSLGLLLALSSGCAKEPAELPAQGVEFWTVPELPRGASLEVNGRAVDPEVIHAYLQPLWAERWDDVADRAAAERAFFADPRGLFEPLVRIALILQEAERRWPVLDAEAVAAADDDLRRSPAVYDALAQRLGEAGMRAHVERELRKRLLLADFSAAAAPVTEDEIYSRYVEMLAEVDDPAALERRGVDFAAMAPVIRAELERARAEELQAAWLDAQVPAARVRAVVPGGGEASW